MGWGLRRAGLLELKVIDIGKTKQEQVKAHYAHQELYKDLMFPNKVINRMYKGSSIMRNWHDTKFMLWA